MKKIGRYEVCGLLGKGGVLMATSHADRTAPSLRGKWLLENLLGNVPEAHGRRLVKTADR